MQISFDKIENFKKVTMVGRLDTAGVGQIEAQFSAGVVAGGQSTLLDLTEVEFLASLGVRMLISTARALSTKGGRMVMYGANPAVSDTIDAMGFDEIVPLTRSEPEAIALLQA
ncbi:MAG TPA: STAS domain-containing protein [Caulobacteraceae bacterium]|jgi:anti-anti-sigma factor